MHQLFLRNIEYQLLIERFLLGAVGTILVVRSFLEITDYPSLSGSGLHIAHLLWGGLIMTVALLLYMLFISTKLGRIIPIIGGIGFGLFIDEVGKFVTSDNNYFFRPSFAIMYVFFVVLYLTTEIVGRRKFSDKEYLVNSLQILQEIIIHKFDKNEQKKALLYLNSAENTQLAKTLKKLIIKSDTIKLKDTFLTRFNLSFESKYQSLVINKWFEGFVILFFLLDALFTILITLAITFGVGLTYLELFLPNIVIHKSKITLLSLLQVESSAVSGLLILYGIFKLSTNKLQSYRFFRWSVLVSLFVTQVFLFYEFQLGALIGFAINIFILTALNYIIVKQRIQVIK